MNKARKKKSKDSSKQDEAHYKNLFSQKVLEIARAVTDNDSYKILTPDILNEIFLFRSRMIKVIADESLHLTPSELNDLKEGIFSNMKSWNLEFFDTGQKITLYDYAGPGLSLYIYLQKIKDNKQIRFQKIYQAFKDFMETKDMTIDLQTFIYRITDYIGWEYTWPNTRILSSTLSFKIADGEPPYLYLEISFKAHPPESIQFTLNGNIRVAYKVFLAVYGHGPKIMKIHPDILSLKSKSKSAELPVYIQQHGLIQLKDKINCTHSIAIYLSLINSLDESRCLFYHGNLLVDFYFVHIKIGYLVVDIVDEKAIIRTFYLLTHVDTPEGDDLQRISVAAKANISCINIDKINTFLFSFIDKNSLLYNLLKQSGCSQLLNLPRKHFEKESIDRRMKEIDEYLLHYKEHQFSFKELLADT